jgi:hypothetical protein
VSRRLRAGRVFLAVAGLALASGAVAVPAGADGEQAVIELKPGDIVKRTISSVNVNDGGQMIAPADCRGDEAPTCDVIRVRLHRDTSEDALNFLRVELTWDGGAQPPDLALVVAGLGLGPVNDLDMYVYDEAGNRIEGTGGASAGEAEVAGILADQDVYDLVINQFTGSTVEYTMEFNFSNEVFESPFESLDPALRDGSAPPPADLSASPDVPTVEPSPGPTPASFEALPVPSPAPATAAVSAVVPAVDADYAGFRGAIDDQLEGGKPLLATPSTASRPAPPAPGALVLLFWLVAVPLAVLALTVGALRRSRPAALAD